MGGTARANPTQRVLLHSLIMNISQEMKVFLQAPDIDFRYESKARKVMVDFKFDAMSP